MVKLTMCHTFPKMHAYTIRTTNAATASAAPRPCVIALTNSSFKFDVFVICVPNDRLSFPEILAPPDLIPMSVDRIAPMIGNVVHDQSYG